MSSTGLSARTIAKKSVSPGREARTKDEWLRPLPGRGEVWLKSGLYSVNETELLEALKGWLISIVNKNTPGYLEHYLSQQDLLQEAQLALLKCWRVYQTRRLEHSVWFTTYAYQSVQGAVIEHYRNRGQVEAAAAGWYVGTVSWSGKGSGDSHSPSEVYGVKTNIKASRFDLEEALLKLEVWERRLLNLYLAEGVTLRELGERAGVTESRACQIYTQVKKKMQRLLGDEYAPGYQHQD